ncbi:chorismate synthase [Desulfocurvibacter africanus]|uniref:chorismate synthase n=2 Tax=Desulfocurvibacter africanus TaxID=873 RepID=UPI000425705C|nr:chorismate synthase [Desulfocurvibacter africanus]
MSGSSFGQMFRLTTFGESHGPAIGGVIDGCPPGIPLSEETIQQELDRRKPGAGIASTARKESDRISLLSGVFEGVTTGTAIGFSIANEDQRSRDYSQVKDVYRPGHADLTYDAKYGRRDYRGGGRASGRETACRVAGGAVAQAFLAARGVRVRAYTLELGGIPASRLDPEGAQDRAFFSPDPQAVAAWTERIKEVKGQGDSLGGVVEIQALGVPAGLGEPVFDKLDARLAYACMSVGAVKAVEIGAGVQSARMTGSHNNDPIRPSGFASNNAGGILGGISSGQPIIVRCAVKPIPSISQEQQTITRDGQATTITIGGRHDISAIPRIVPVLKAMVLLTLADMWMLQAARRY